MLIERPHRNLAMKMQIRRQNYSEYRAPNDRRDGVHHIYPVKHINGLLWIRGRSLKRVSRVRAELIAQRNASAWIDAYRTAAHLNGDRGRCGAANRIGHVLPNQIAHGR